MTHPPELRELAKQLREDGLLIKEISARIGIPKPTVTRWLNPELEERGREVARKRKFRKRRRCPRCKTNMKADRSKWCESCFREHRRYWTRERVVQAIKDWAIENGRQPTWTDWRRSGRGHPAIRTITDGPNPTFKNWSEALIAAGFTPNQRRPAKRRGPRTEEQRLITQRKVRETHRQKMELRRKLREEKIKKAIAKENPDGGSGR